MARSHSSRIIKYHFGLRVKSEKIQLPPKVEWLFPYSVAETRSVMTQFYDKYYGDFNPRKLIFGINPGRLGAGITGVPFTDPVRLQVECGIENSFPQKRELSAEFIYSIVHKYGGLEKFYTEFYISSVCPLGFVKEGINFNYYDDKNLQQSVRQFIVENISIQIKLVNGNREIAFCLGEGKNFAFFEKLNEEHNFFEKIIPLPHPRWIMQYKRKSLDQYLDLYLQRLV